jgi:hypothetical protein
MGIVRSQIFTGIVAGAVAFSGSASSASWNDKVLSGDVSPNGTTLIAGAHGVRYELRSGAKVELSQGAEFSFEPSLHLKLRKPSDPDTTTRVIHLVRGAAEVTVPTLRDPTAVLITGPGKLSAVAKEGHLTFFTDDVRSTAAAREGEMLVGVGNEWRPLKAGYARTLAPENPSALPRPVLPSPSVSTESPLTLVRGSESAHVRATWAALPNAARYEVTLRRTGKDASLVSHQIVTDGKTSIDSLTPGTYSLVVAAVDKEGLIGSPSAPCALRVVGIETPEGATTSQDGAIILGRDQRVSVVAAEGIEISYGSSSLFMGAPSQLGLAHGEPTMVRFRTAGSAEETILHLAPRGLHAAVDIGPHTAKWPLDRVTIQVDLYDTTGRPIPDESSIDANVTVNMTKVPVKWEHSGHSLRATLSPGTPPGPWVVRAEIRDRNGDLLGRDFLEVAPLETAPATVATR